MSLAEYFHKAMNAVAQHITSAGVQAVAAPVKIITGPAKDLSGITKDVTGIRLDLVNTKLTEVNTELAEHELAGKKNPIHMASFADIKEFDPLYQTVHDKDQLDRARALRKLLPLVLLLIYLGCALARDGTTPLAVSASRAGIVASMLWLCVRWLLDNNNGSTYKSSR